MDDNNEEKIESNPYKKSRFELFSSFLFRKFLILSVLFALFPECSSFSPRNAQSSLIIVQMTIVKDEMLVDELMDPRFQKVTLRKGESVIQFNENSEHYYYFQNLKEGQYEIFDAIHLLNRGASDFSYGSTKTAKQNRYWL